MTTPIPPMDPHAYAFMPLPDGKPNCEAILYLLTSMWLVGDNKPRDVHQFSSLMTRATNVVHTGGPPANLARKAANPSHHPTAVSQREQAERELAESQAESLRLEAIVAEQKERERMIAEQIANPGPDQVVAGAGGVTAENEVGAPGAGGDPMDPLALIPQGASHADVFRYTTMVQQGTLPAVAAAQVFEIPVEVPRAEQVQPLPGTSSVAVMPEEAPAKPSQDPAFKPAQRIIRTPRPGEPSPAYKAPGIPQHDQPPPLPPRPAQ